MKKALLLAALVIGCLGTMAPSCQPAEPAMTITAKPDPYPLAATKSHIRGVVTPSTATTKVTLQRTVGGKWVDWQACDATDGCTTYPPKVPRANVNQTTGAYAIEYPVQFCGQILHLRVRSSGGTTTSPGFYTQADPNESC